MESTWSAGSQGWTGGGLEVDSMDYMWTGGGLHEGLWGSVRCSKEAEAQSTEKLTNIWRQPHHQWKHINKFKRKVKICGDKSKLTV